MTNEISQELAAKRDRLLALLAGYGRVAVAYSGGIDSTVVAKAAQLACGDQAVAVTAVSLSLASGELEEAQELARQIGIRHQIIRTQEFEDPNYLRNATNRCYFCKTELYTRLEEIFPQLNVDVVVNGANSDDLGDYRPGMLAASEHHVRSPLIEVGLNKTEVRGLALHWDLPTWDKPAMPCLSSRIAYGVAVTPERVRQVDMAEQYLRQQGFREFRVRIEANNLARIEVALADLPRFLDPEFRSAVTTKLRSLGLQYITLDLEGFRSGSMNAVVPMGDLRASTAKLQS